MSLQGVIIYYYEWTLKFPQKKKEKAMSGNFESVGSGTVSDPWDF